LLTACHGPIRKGRKEDEIQYILKFFENKKLAKTAKCLDPAVNGASAWPPRDRIAITFNGSRVAAGANRG